MGSDERPAGRLGMEAPPDLGRRSHHLRPTRRQGPRSEWVQPLWPCVVGILSLILFLYFFLVVCLLASWAVDRWPAGWLMSLVGAASSRSQVRVS